MPVSVKDEPDQEQAQERHCLSQLTFDPRCEQGQKPVPVGPSPVAPVAATSVPSGAVAAPTSSDGASRRDRHCDQGDRSHESSTGPISSRTRRRLSQIDSKQPPNVLNNNNRSRATRAPVSAPVPPISHGRVRSKQDQPRRPARSVVSATSHPYYLRTRVTHRGLTNGPPLARTGVGNNRFESHAAVNWFLHENGIDLSSQVKLQDVPLADATPAVKSAHFTALFGGLPLHERPRLHSRMGNRDIICLDPVAHPYAPSSPGEPGVLFFVPGAFLFKDNYPSYRIFINKSPPKTPCMKRRYQYLGDYTTVPTTSTTVELEEWHSLPTSCRAAWLWRIRSSEVRDIRAIHAQVSIRNKRPYGPPPSQSEIEEWLGNHKKRYEGMRTPTLMDAFNEGEESLHLVLVKCIQYNIEVATKLRGIGGRDRATIA